MLGSEISSGHGGVSDARPLASSPLAASRGLARTFSWRSGVCATTLRFWEMGRSNFETALNSIDVFAERSFLSPFTKESRVNTS